LSAVGIQFERPSKLHYFDAGELKLNLGDQVVVHTEDGHSVGRVTLLPGDQRFHPDSSDKLPAVVRLATEHDLGQLQRNRRRELDAYAICLKRVRAMNLPMKLVKALFTLGGGKVTYYFCSEQRVDFRYLIDELTQELGMKIEIKQLGVRDATGLLGGVGICGREYCCSTFLTSFQAISIKMAKVQNLSLNPEKVSGGCGRLRCCLQYELDLYHELSRDLPKVGKRVTTPQGPGKVKNVEILKRLIQVDLGYELGIHTFQPDEVKFEKGPAQQQRQAQNKDTSKDDAEEAVDSSLDDSDNSAS
jgi:cell fate regulator YaaT (PSP1 superfamily)